MLTVNIPTDQAIFIRVPLMAGAIRTRIKAAVWSLTTELQAYVVKNKLSGQVLNKISGHLQQSIQQTAIETGTEITGYVYSAGDVKYAAIHEYGGIIHHPGSDKFQAFMGSNGAMVFTNHTAPHVINMPERSYLRSSLAENAQHITDTLQEAAVIAVTE